MKCTVLIIVSVFLLGLTAKVRATQIPTERAVNAILGEGSNQSYLAMVGIACAIRNRGTLHGVYGEHNAVVKQASARLRAQAKRAWLESAHCDIVGGCRFFGSKKDRHYFVGKLHFHPVLTIGDITFYSPRKIKSEFALAN